MSTTDDDLIVFRRRSAHAGQWVSCDRPRVKLEVERGTFVIFKRVAELLGVGKGDAVMFAFNRREGCAYIYREEPEEDSYFLTCPKGSYFRFTSKELMRFFVEFFELEDENVVYFDVERVANEKGMFRMGMIAPRLRSATAPRLRSATSLGSARRPEEEK